VEQGSATWPHDAVTDHGAADAAFIDKDVTAIREQGERAFAPGAAIAVTSLPSAHAQSGFNSIAV